MTFQIPPVPTYRKSLKTMEDIYKKAFLRAVEQLTNVSPDDLLKEEIYRSQIQQISVLMNELNGETKLWIKTTLEEAFIESQASAMVTMGLSKSLIEAKGVLKFSLLSRNRIESMINDTFSDVLKAHSVMGAGLKKLVRTTQAEVLRVNTALQRGTVTSAKDLKTALIGKGFSKSLVEDNWKGITDASGRRWDLTTYTKMVARTKLQQVQLEGARITSLENEKDLAIISSHGAKDACANFEGLVVSLHGNTRGYRTLAEVKASGLIFHPNCQHSVHPINDVDALPSRLMHKSYDAEDTAGDALGNIEKYRQRDNARRYQRMKQKRDKVKATRKASLVKARAIKKDPSLKPVKEAPLTFVPAKTLKEASDFGMKMGLKVVDYKGFDLEYANDLNQQFEILSRKYPEIVDTIKFLGTSQRRNKGLNDEYFKDYFGKVVKSGYGVQILQTYGQKHGMIMLEAKAKQNFRKPAGKVASNNVASASNHTWGDWAGIAFNATHTKDYTAMKASNAYSVKVKWHPIGTESPVSTMSHEFAHKIDYFLEEAGFRHIIMEEVNKVNVKGASWIKENLSQYASTNDREIIAEAFSEYMHNPNPRPSAIAIGEAMERAMIEWRKSQ